MTPCFSPSWCSSSWTCSSRRCASRRDAHQEGAQGPDNRRGVEGHRLAHDGRVHQVPVQDRPQVPRHRRGGHAGAERRDRLAHREGGNH